MFGVGRLGFGSVRRGAQLRGEGLQALAFVAQRVGVLEGFVGDRFQLADAGQRIVVTSGQLVAVGSGVGHHVLHPAHQPDRRRVVAGEVLRLEAAGAPGHTQQHHHLVGGQHPTREDLHPA